MFIVAAKPKRSGRCGPAALRVLSTAVDGLALPFYSLSPPSSFLTADSSFFPPGESFGNYTGAKAVGRSARASRVHYVNVTCVNCATERTTAAVSMMASGFGLVKLQPVSERHSAAVVANQCTARPTQICSLAVGEVTGFRGQVWQSRLLVGRLNGFQRLSLNL